MNKIKNLLPALVMILCLILYVFIRPWAETIMSVLSPLLMIYFGFIIMRNRKRLAEDYMSRFGKGSFLEGWSLQYREKPLRLTITLAGVSLIGIGLLGLLVALSKSADSMFEGFSRIAMISAVLAVMGSGFIAIITALFMLKRR